MAGQGSGWVGSSLTCWSARVASSVVGSRSRREFSSSGRRASAWAVSRVRVTVLLSTLRVQVGSKHADEHMGPDPGLGPVVDRAQVQVDALDRAEVSFDPGQRLVGRHDLCGIHLLGADGGADDVDPVQGRFGGDLVLVAGERETRGRVSVCHR